MKKISTTVTVFLQFTYPYGVKYQHMMRAFIVTFAVVVLLLIAVGAAFWFGTQNPDAEVAVPEVDVDVTMPNEDTVENPIPTAEDGTPILTPSPQISPTGAPTISPTQTEETTQ